MIFNRLTVYTCFLFTVILISCTVPTARSRALVGSADHSGGIANVGSDTSLPAPQDLIVKNNKTAQETYLTLEWTPVPDATGYRVYRAVYPTYTHTVDLDDKAFKLLKEITQPYPQLAKISVTHDIPEVPLRRYAYRVTSVRYWGESVFSQSVIGSRMPVNANEALRDIDYTMHFAQSAIPDFGAQGLEEIVSGRASGQYHYASKMTNIKNNFSYYADFETILSGNPNMQIILTPIGTKMNGDISATGLYQAKVTYTDLIGVIGGLTKGGTITIEYQHPNGTQTETYTYTEASKFLKTVALNADGVFPVPPRREWDESDPNYVR